MQKRCLQAEHRNSDTVNFRVSFLPLTRELCSSRKKTIKKKKRQRFSCLTLQHFPVSASHSEREVSGTLAAEAQGMPAALTIAVITGLAVQPSSSRSADTNVCYKEANNCSAFRLLHVCTP